MPQFQNLVYCFEGAPPEYIPPIFTRRTAVELAHWNLDRSVDVGIDRNHEAFLSLCNGNETVSLCVYICNYIVDIFILFCYTCVSFSIHLISRRKKNIIYNRKWGVFVTHLTLRTKNMYPTLKPLNWIICRNSLLRDLECHRIVYTSLPLTVLRRL